jgi:response regulator RpfG family c-di-GMP phosphodiesterase
MIRWYDSIVFKILLFFVLFAIILPISMIATFSLISKEELRENAYTNAILTSEKIVADLEKDQARVETLVKVLASIAETFTQDYAHDRAIVKKVLTRDGEESLVGGGVWFEPFVIDPDRERLSHFFSRNGGPGLHHVDKYDDPQAQDYHHKEWYAPLRALTKGKTYWSRVYTDPYTHISMITASTGIHRSGTFIGVATVDIRLEGLDDYLAKKVRPLEGYALLIDREEQFISHPQALGTQGDPKTMMMLHDLKSPDSELLIKAIQSDLDQDAKPTDQAMIDTLVMQSDEIDENDAEIIASMIDDLRKGHDTRHTHQRIMLEDDALLGEEAFATIFTLPTNRWRLVIVLPARKAFAQSIQIYQNMLFITIFMTLVVSIIGYLFLRKIAVMPMRSLSDQLQDTLESNDLTTLLATEDKGELGNLVYWFNRRSNALHEQYAEVKALNQEIEETQKEVVFTMGAIGESRSKETGNHVRRVAEYSRLLARYYGLDEKEAEMLKQASPMHDIGKVAIPDVILNKPEPFDVADRKVMDTHAELGHEMLKHSKRPLLHMASVVAYEHHERWDGTGYPRGLKGEEIDIYGRITALADVFDALGSERVYKPAWDDEEIFRLFKAERGRHFDPRLVDIFFEHLDEFLAVRDQLQDV